MANATTANTRKPIHSASYGNASVFTDALSVATTNLTAADNLRYCEVPGGTLVHRVVVKNTDMDVNATPTLTAKIGFTPVDGSAAPSGADTAVAATAAWGQSAATTAYDILPPYLVTADSYLSIVIGTGAATAAAGTINAAVSGEVQGIA